MVPFPRAVTFKTLINNGIRGTTIYRIVKFGVFSFKRFRKQSGDVNFKSLRLGLIISPATKFADPIISEVRRLSANIIQMGTNNYLKKYYLMKSGPIYQFHFLTRKNEVDSGEAGSRLDFFSQIRQNHDRTRLKQCSVFVCRAEMGKDNI